MKIARKIQGVKPSATLSITAKAKAMITEGQDVIVLAAGEPDHDTPQVIKDAAIKAINSGFTKYTPTSGTLTLKKAISRKLKNDNNLSYETDEIVVSCGAKHSLYNVIQVLCDPGDEVLIVHPFWVSYPEMAVLAGAVPKILTTRDEDGFKLQPGDLKKSISKNTKILILNSPSNPAGVVYDKKELEAIADVCLSNGLTIISDEIYEKIIYDGKKHVSIASLSEEAKKATIVINGVSKSHSMTGWRIGYMAGDRAVAKMVTTLQDQSTSNPCSISQVATECALTSDMENEFKVNLDKFQKRRDFLLERLAKEDKIKPLRPEGAFYLFCDISRTKMDSFTFAQRLLEEKKVAVIPGAPFGDDRYIRISFATDMKTIEEGIERIKEWVKKAA